MREPDTGLTGGDDVPAILRRVGDRLAGYVAWVGLERWARIGSVALLPVLLSDSDLTTFAPLVLSLSAYVVLTGLAGRNRYLRAADLVVASMVIFVAGADVIGFLPFLVVTVAGPAVQGGLLAGVAAPGTLTSVLLARAVIGGASIPAAGAQVTPIAMMLLLAGVTTAAASQVLNDRSVHDRLVLQRANRLLSSLRDMANDIPGGLDVLTVSAALVAELRSIPGVTRGVVYAEDHGVMRPAAAAGVELQTLAPLRVDVLRALAVAPRLQPPRATPDAIRDVLGDDLHWFPHPLGPLDPLRGVLLVGFREVQAARAARGRLHALAVDGGLALENARLFDGTRSRASDVARRRVAGDLHDGVAQSLAHLRMELELMAMAEGEGASGELSRLARVATTALTDLRGTIDGLRQPPEGDLASMLARYLDDIRTPHGPTIILESSGIDDLDPDRTDEVLRVAQEAVSNALRHAQAEHIVVRLDQHDETVTFSVEDDGVGRGVRTGRRGGGVGMRSMRERADRLTGVLDIRDRSGGGTHVLLRFPARLTTVTGRRP